MTIARQCSRKEVYVIYRHELYILIVITQSPQLVFTATHKSADPLFFLIYFTAHGRNVNILEAQQSIVDHLWTQIRRNLPHKEFEAEVGDGFAVLKMRKGANSMPYSDTRSAG